MSLVNIENKVTRKNIVKVGNALLRSRKAKLFYGPESKEIKVVAKALDLIGIVNHDEFLKSCCITIDHDIFTFFKLGDKAIPYNLQVAIICHELAHVDQAGIVFFLDYLTSTTHRARYETEALAVEGEVMSRLTGTLFNASNYAKKLAWYKCTAADIKVSTRQLNAVVTALKNGAEISNMIPIIANAVK